MQLDLEERGLTLPAELGVGEGPLGFWGARSEVFPSTWEQRCWAYETANVLNHPPRGRCWGRPWRRCTRSGWRRSGAAAERAWERFIEANEAKYPAAVECLRKDRLALLAFCDVPAQHWVHLCTTPPIRSAFPTVRHRTDQAKGCVTRATRLAFIYKLGMGAEQNCYYRMRRCEQLAKVIDGVKFRDGIEVNEATTDRRVAADLERA